MKQIPIIRFSQFDNKWSSIAIGNLAQIKRGASPRPIQDPKWFDKNSDIGWLRISDVTEQNGRIKYLEQKISKLGQEKTRVLNTPHLLLSIAATVGKPVVNYVKTGVHDGFLIFENPKFDREFMFQWFDMFRTKWNKYGQPGSQVNLNSDIIRNHKMMIPSLPEQQVIGSFFRTLDDLLTSYKDNLANYQSLKATMLSKMFPKAGQIVPEIRLDGFERKWEKKKLIDLVSPVSRKVKKPSEPYYRLSIRSHAKGTFKQFVDDPKKVSMDNLFEVKENDLVVNITFAWEHAIAVASKEDDGLLVSHRFPTFVIDKSDKNFISIYIKREEFRQKMDLLSPGGAGRNRVLNVKDFIKIQMIVPELKEQQAIGAYFSNLDYLINSHQEKISQLETLKKKLLQDMFI